MARFGGRSTVTAAAAAKPRRHAGRRGFQVLANSDGGGPVSSTTMGGGSGDRAFAAAAWSYYEAVPEFRATADFIAACLSRVVLRPGWLGDDDKPGPLFDDEGNVRKGIDVPEPVVEMSAKLIRSLRTVPGGQSALMKAFGQNLAVPADCFMVGTEQTRDGRGYQRNFEVLSTDELRLDPNQPKGADGKPRYQRYDKVTGGQGEALPPDSFVLRVWDPHPRIRKWANPFSTPALTTLEAMRLLTLEELSQSRSRLKGPGVYWIDDSIELPNDDEEQSEEQAFTLAMVKVFSTAIGDPGSAAANVPIIMRAPRDSIREGIRLDSFDIGDQRTAERRDALVSAYARGAPVPPEVVLGHMSTTFANAFMIDETTMKIYVASPLELICGHLSTGYLHPSLQAEFGRDGAEPKTLEALERLVVWYDASELVVPADRAKNAASAVGTERNPSFLISLSASRKYQGFRESDRPDEEEIAARMERASLLGAPQFTQQRDIVGDDALADTITAPPSGTAASAAPTPPSNSGADRSNTNGTPTNGQASLAVQLAHAADYAADRAIERLGSRLVERVKRDATLTTDQRNQVLAEKATLAARLGRDRVKRLLGDDLWPGEFVAFEAKARQWAKECHHPKPELAAARARQMVEALATERLFDAKASVSPATVTKMLAVA